MNAEFYKPSTARLAEIACLPLHCRSLGTAKLMAASCGRNRESVTRFESVFIAMEPRWIGTAVSEREIRLATLLAEAWKARVAELAGIALPCTSCGALTPADDSTCMSCGEDAETERDECPSCDGHGYVLDPDPNDYFFETRRSCPNIFCLSGWVDRPFRVNRETALAGRNS